MMGYWLSILCLTLIPSCLTAQEISEKMPGHITKVQKLQDVNVNENRPHYVRLKGYYRSYQTNDSVLKYYKDGIVEYYINLKKVQTDLNTYTKRYLRNSQLIAEDKKRAFTVSDDGTFRPWPEGKTFIEQCRKKYQIADSTQRILLNNQPIGAITKDCITGICQIEVNQLPTYEKLTHQLFGYTKEDTYDHMVEAYRISPEDYYSFKDLIFQKTDNSYYFSHKKDKQRQHIHVITELFITEKEYVAEKHSTKQKAESPQEATNILNDFCSTNKIPSLPASTELALKKLTPYNPANLKDIKE